MENLKIKDLVEGEIYKGKFSHNSEGIIFKWEGKFHNDCEFPALNLKNNCLIIENGYLTAE